jgi:hypothetical protein
VILIVFFLLGLLFPWVLFVGALIWLLMGLYRIVTEHSLTDVREFFMRS